MPQHLLDLGNAHLPDIRGVGIVDASLTPLLPFIQTSEASFAFYNSDNSSIFLKPAFIYTVDDQ